MSGTRISECFLRNWAIAGGDLLSEQRKKMYSGADLLVATPERL